MVGDPYQDVRTLLISRTDSDGLVSGVFDEIKQDWVRVGRFWVHLDRRFPWELAQCFCQHPDLLAGLRLRLDPTEVAPAEGHPWPMRKAHWWGAHFRWEDLESYGPEIKTVHADPTNHLQALNKIAKAVFRWNRPRDQNIAVLQIEEFRDEPRAGKDLTTRYLHSILDRQKRAFTHLDGAIKTYTPEGYARAYDGADEKSDRYEKLFRTDDAFPLGEQPWLACVASFFRLNEMVREYFGGSDAPS